MALKQFDDVTMLSAPGSLGWIKDIKTDKFGEPSALVVWEHHGGVRTVIPLRKLTLVVDTSEV